MVKKGQKTNLFCMSNQIDTVDGALAKIFEGETFVEELVGNIGDLGQNRRVESGAKTGNFTVRGQIGELELS